MPKYIVFRTVGKLSEEEIQAAGSRSVEALVLMTEVRCIRSYYSAAEGKNDCQYEARSAELIFEHARLAGIPIDYASQVVRELRTRTFRRLLWRSWRSILPSISIPPWSRTRSSSMISRSSGTPSSRSLLAVTLAHTTAPTPLRVSSTSSEPDRRRPGRSEVIQAGALDGAREVLHARTAPSHDPYRASLPEAPSAAAGSRASPRPAARPPLSLAAPRSPAPRGRGRRSSPQAATAGSSAPETLSARSSTRPSRPRRGAAPRALRRTDPTQPAYTRRTVWASSPAASPQPAPAARTPDPRQARPAPPRDPSPARGPPGASSPPPRSGGSTT